MREEVDQAAERREKRNEPKFNLKPYLYIQRKVPVYEMAPDETLELIENNAELILEEIGIEFRDDPEALEIWKQAGANLDGERVRFEPGMLREIIQFNAPSSFTQFARNPEKSVLISKDTAVFAPAYGPPFIRNLDEGRRYATIEDFRNFVKLTYMSPPLHHSGGTVCEPVDLPVNKRHFDMVYSHLKYSDKPFMGSVTSGARAQDTVDMAKIVFGDEFVNNNTCILSLINVNSPMTFDDTMLAALKVYARNMQGTVISPFILAGAMSPVTVVGTLHSDTCRSNDRNGLCSVGKTWRTGDIRHIQQFDLNAVRGSDFWHTRTLTGAVHLCGSRTQTQSAVQKWWRIVCVENPGCSSSL